MSYIPLKISVTWYMSMHFVQLALAFKLDPQERLVMWSTHVSFLIYHDEFWPCAPDHYPPFVLLQLSKKKSPFISGNIILLYNNNLSHSHIPSIVVWDLHWPGIPYTTRAALRGSALSPAFSCLLSLSCSVLSLKVAFTVSRWLGVYGSRVWQKNWWYL